MTNLSINFLANGITEDAKIELMQAIDHERISMEIQLTSDEIKKLGNKIENKHEIYTEEEVQAFRAQLIEKEAHMKTLKEDSEESRGVHDKVVDTMSLRNENGFGNSKDVVRTVLRVLGTWENGKLVKYAIIPAFKSPALYEALEAIHVNSKAGENGNITMSNSVKEAYKNASAELDTIIKTTFSLPFETPYTSKTRVKMTAEDKKLLNDCYIRGFKNRFSVDKDDNVTFEKRTLNTLVKVRKNKKTGEMTYDYTGLATTICNIVMKHYFA